MRLICNHFRRTGKALSTRREQPRYRERTAPQAGLSYTTREGDDDEAVRCSPRRGDVCGHELRRGRAGQEDGQEDGQDGKEDGQERRQEEDGKEEGRRQEEVRRQERRRQVTRFDLIQRQGASL